MDRLVSSSDMIGTLNLALHDDRKKTFNQIVDEKQEDYLIRLLGDYLYNQFETGLSQPVIEQKWLDLRDGADFEVESQGETLVLKWAGLNNMLKYFIYYEYQLWNQTQNTVVGDTKKQNLNSVYANVSRKLSDSYNKGRELYGIDTTKLRSQLVYDPLINDCSRAEFYRDYRNEKITQELYKETKIKASAYNFIKAKNDEVADTYPNWRFTKLQHSNIFNI